MKACYYNIHIKFSFLDLEKKISCPEYAIFLLSKVECELYFMNLLINVKDLFIKSYKN